MELRERLAAAAATSTNGKDEKAEQAPGTADSFAEVKNRVHMAVISELGPELYDADLDAKELRARVMAKINEHLARETGIAREDRVRLADEIADDTLGHGPIERLLADESVTEVMVNGPFDVWAEREGKLHHTGVRFNDECAPPPHHQQDRGADRAPGRRVVADGGRAAARRQPRQRGAAAALAHRAAADDPQVQQVALGHERPHPARHADRANRRLLRALHRGRAEHPDLRRHGLRQDDDAQRDVDRDPEQATASSRSRTRPSCD